MKGQRSASYPSYSIDKILGFTEKIYKIYGSSYRATREEIAEALSISVGAIIKKMSAAVQYGFLDMKSKVGYQVTDLFVQWYRPINDDDKREARIQALKNPTLYNALIETFEDNILPPSRPLANILLQKHNIAEKVCEHAAGVFEDNLNSIGLLDENRTLRFDEKKFINEDDEDFIDNTFEEVNDTNIQPQNNFAPVIIPPVIKDDKQKNNESNNKSNGTPIPHNIPLKNKLPAQLLLPSDVDAADFDFIISYIGLIRNQY